MDRAEVREVLCDLMAVAAETRRRVLKALAPPLVRALEEEWWWQAHGGQIAPEPDWRVWAIVAGRGFGKTRAGAEWVWARARENAAARIALVGASLDEVAKVMIEGESGLIACARSDEEARWVPSRGTLAFPSGATAFAYSAAQPGKLRGAQQHFAWCDELAKWPNADAAWDNLMLGLRLGAGARAVVTTTPQPVPVLTRVLAQKGCVRTHGRTDDNPHLAADFIEAVRGMYAGTRIGRQELDGVLLEDVPGALWTRETIAKARAPFDPAQDERSWRRVVVGVDPPVSAGGDACGIVVCGLGEDGIGQVLADLSVGGLRPEGWARRVAEAAALWQAGRIVAENNQGGDMVESVLKAADPGLAVKLVTATRGKAARAAPIALRFEAGTAKLAGNFPELEDELCAISWRGYEGTGSPDRADAMVWAMTELFERARAAPRIVTF